MDSATAFRLTELLCARLCHELISPVSAVNNGLELVGDGNTDIFAEALGLLRRSAGEASRRLQFYRLAFGQAAGLDTSGGVAAARQLASGLFDGGKIHLDWPEGDLDSSIRLGKPAAKLLLNMVALAGEALPRGGTIAVRITPGGKRAEAEVSATGTGAGLRDEMRAAIDPTARVDSLDPRTVQGYFTARLADQLAAEFALDESQSDAVCLRARLALVDLG